MPKVVAERAQAWLKPSTSEDQIGFAPGGGTDDAHQASKNIQEEIAQGKAGSAEVVMPLYDIEKACSWVCMSALWKLMKIWGCDDRFIWVCRALHNHTRVLVRVHEGICSGYIPAKGLMEGCPTYPPLFAAHHTPAMNDFENRRNVATEAAEVTRGIKWVVKMEGKLTHVKRRTGHVEGTGMGKVVGTKLYNKQKK